MELVLLGSENAHVGMDAGRAILYAGGSALDAVEAVARVVEDDADDHTVGYGGYPNLLGEVELDASVMDGDRRAGAVAGLRGVRNPVSVARQVLERLPHVLLVGDGAARFADECGLERREMLTPAAAETWRRGLAAVGGPVAPGEPLAEKVRHLVLDPEHVTGTVNVLARDERGRLASAASTSGWAWKYPGRAGDTGSIGAGNYCDGRYGAATCTGWGELAVRAGAARTVVLLLRAGSDPHAACEDVLADLPDAGMGEAETPLHVLCLHADGRHAAYSTASGRRYAYWDDTLGAPEVRDRVARPFREGA